jgi:hypothetical protein
MYISLPGAYYCTSIGIGNVLNAVTKEDSLYSLAVTFNVLPHFANL